jgi:hypothetical protein
MTSREQPELLLDRLKRLQAGVAASTVETDVQPKLVSSDFAQLARIALTLARTECLKNDQMDRLTLLRQIEIVPDEAIPDAHNNEVNLTNFVRSNVPEKDWPMFIDVSGPK